MKQLGQAVLEYILTLIVTIALMSSLVAGFRQAVFFVWNQLACEIAASCPTCPPPQAVRDRLVGGSCVQR